MKIREKAGNFPFSGLKMWITQGLVDRYSDSFRFFQAKPVNEILKQVPSSALTNFKDKLFYDCTEDTLRRFYRKSESDVRMKNYSAFYCSLPKLEPIFEKLSCRKIMRKRKKRIEKLCVRQTRPSFKAEALTSSRRNLLKRLDRKEEYLSRVDSSHSCSSLQGSKEPQTFEVVPRAVRVTDLIQRGEAHDIYDNSVLDKKKGKRSYFDLKFISDAHCKSIPTEVSDLANLPESEIMSPSSNLDATVNSSFLAKKRSSELTLLLLTDKLRDPEQGRFRKKTMSPKQRRQTVKDKPSVNEAPAKKETKERSRSRTNIHIKKSNPAPLSLSRVNKKMSLEHKTLLKTRIGHSSSSMGKPSTPLRIENSHMLLIQPHEINTGSYKTFRGSRDKEQWHMNSFKPQAAFALSDKLREKLREKTGFFWKKLECDATRATSPEGFNAKCFTERNSRGKKPNLISGQAQVTSRQPLLNLSPNFCSAKSRSELSCSIKTPHMFKTLRIGQSPKNAMLFRELFKGQSMRVPDTPVSKPFGSTRTNKNGFMSGSSQGGTIFLAKNCRSKCAFETTKDQTRPEITPQSKKLTASKSFSLLKKQKQLQYLPNY